MTELVIVRLGVPQGTTADAVWVRLQSQPALQRVIGARLYQPTRGFFEPTEWVYCGDVDRPLGAFDLPADRLPVRKVESYPFRNQVNPFGLELLGSGMPMQLVTITVLDPLIERFEAWYSEHADVLSRAPGATGARRYWQDGSPRRYASLYYYESEEGIERYLPSDVRAQAATSRLVFDPWLVDQHHAYYRDVTPAG
ncbi:MAG: hypothetical protein U0556_19110 [Dehalococcoidia bacterium]